MTADATRYQVRFLIEDSGEVLGELTRYHAPMTVDEIAKALPLEGRAARWKQEIYFPVAVKLGAEKAKADVDRGAIAYWPMGSAICVFYGDSRPYSPVNIIGKITENLELFAGTKPGTKIRLEKV